MRPLKELEENSSTDGMVSIEKYHQIVMPNRLITGRITVDCPRGLLLSGIQRQVIQEFDGEVELKVSG